MSHTWQGTCCIECEADVSWCDNPPTQPAKPPLGLVPRFIMAEHRFTAIDEAIKRYLSAYQVIPMEWIEERNEIIEYLQNKDK